MKAKEVQGTGLGMYIVKTILDHIDSKIMFYSKEGEGTTFVIKIPLTGMPKKKGTMKLS